MLLVTCCKNLQVIWIAKIADLHLLNELFRPTFEQIVVEQNVVELNLFEQIRFDFREIKIDQQCPKWFV